MSPAQARKRRKRLAKAERHRLANIRRAEEFHRNYQSMMDCQRREYEAYLRRRNRWYRRLLRWLTGGYFG